METAVELESVIKEELKILEADEKAAKNRKSMCKIEETALTNSVTVVKKGEKNGGAIETVSYTHLRAHETRRHL
eukprot:11339149-Prorocentrum_lima.AAC.1